MLNRCQHIAQSKKQDELSLFGAPFSITVTTINKNSFNKRRRLGGAARKIPKVRHQINNKSLIKFNNPDNMNHCLFFALIASLTQNICSWPSLKFFYYINNLKGMAGRFQKDTYEIMNQIGAQIGLNEYDADEWIPRIVDLGIMLNVLINILLKYLYSVTMVITNLNLNMDLMTTTLQYFFTTMILKNIFMQ
uniref:Uncharacterized protein n=1 Tax=Meloidogyne enterolobii TaxID=390850 RepID=A0A6V7WFG7_MELEN|nr:unnamed protein product [Meloidogyne enterolobii]